MANVFCGNGKERIHATGPRKLPCWYYSSTPHTLYKNSSTISCKEKEKPSIAMTRSIYPGWLLNGSLTVIEGPANLRAEADVFVAPDAEQMRGTFLVAIENWNILPSEASWSVKTILTVIQYKWEKCAACVRMTLSTWIRHLGGVQAASVLSNRCEVKHSLFERRVGCLPAM